MEPVVVTSEQRRTARVLKKLNDDMFTHCYNPDALITDYHIRSREALQTAVDAFKNSEFLDRETVYMYAICHPFADSTLVDEAASFARYEQFFGEKGLIRGILNSPHLTAHTFNDTMYHVPLMLPVDEETNRLALSHPLATEQTLKMWIDAICFYPSLAGNIPIIADPNWTHQNLISPKERSRLLVTVASL